MYFPMSLRWSSYVARLSAIAEHLVFITDTVVGFEPFTELSDDFLETD